MMVRRFTRIAHTIGSSSFIRLVLRLCWPTSQVNERNHAHLYQRQVFSYKVFAMKMNTHHEDVAAIFGNGLLWPHTAQCKRNYIV